MSSVAVCEAAIRVKSM